MHKRERYFAMLNDNRTVQPFGWGAEFVVPGFESRLQAANGSDNDNPRIALSDFSQKAIANSDEYFAAPDGIAFTLEKRMYPTAASLSAEELKDPPPQREIETLTWHSAVETPSKENNTAVAAYFPTDNKRAAVIVLPHWNAKAGTYFDLCKFFNKVGMSALRLTLPYHEERMPPELERADHLVAPNVGRSLQSITQAVSDTRACITWLKEQGYEKVGIVGTSIGSPSGPSSGRPVFCFFSIAAWRSISTITSSS